MLAGSINLEGKLETFVVSGCEQPLIPTKAIPQNIIEGYLIKRILNDILIE